jgi:hypothetical protein
MLHALPACRRCPVGVGVVGSSADVMVVSLAALHARWLWSWCLVSGASGTIVQLGQHSHCGHVATASPLQGIPYATGQGTGTFDVPWSSLLRNAGIPYAPQGIVLPLRSATGQARGRRPLGRYSNGGAATSASPERLDAEPGAAALLCFARGRSQPQQTPVAFPPLYDDDHRYGQDG